MDIGRRCGQPTAGAPTLKQTAGRASDYEVKSALETTPMPAEVDGIQDADDRSTTLVPWCLSTPCRFPISWGRDLNLAHNYVTENCGLAQESWPLTAPFIVGLKGLDPVTQQRRMIGGVLDVLYFVVSQNRPSAQTEQLIPSIWGTG